MKRGRCISHSLVQCLGPPRRQLAQSRSAWGPLMLSSPLTVLRLQAQGGAQEVLQLGVSVCKQDGGPHHSGSALGVCSSHELQQACAHNGEQQHAAKDTCKHGPHHTTNALPLSPHTLVRGPMSLVTCLW